MNIRKADVIPRMPMRDESLYSKESKCYYAFNIPGLQYRFALYPNGINDETRNDVVLCLIVNGYKHRKVQAKLKFSIKSANVESESKDFIFNTYIGQGIYICSFDELLNSTNKFFINGEMNMKIEGSLAVERSLIPVSLLFSSFYYSF